MTRVPREAAVVAAVQRLLTKRGAYWVNVHGSGVGRNGVADILACHHGRWLALECKRPGGRPTKLQAYELERVRAAGGIGAVVTSAAQVGALLDRIEDEEL